MKWLLWREYRLNRLIVVVGLTLLLTPYLVAALVLLLAPLFVPEGLTRPGIPSFYIAFGGAAMYSLILSHLTVAFLGGNAIAGERADRSAEFTAYLPLSRHRKLASKWILSACVIATIWVVNLAALGLAVALLPETRENAFHGFGPQLGVLALTGFAFYGVGWFLSSVQSVPTFAVCGGLITPFFVMMLVMATAWTVGRQSDGIFMTVGYVGVNLILAVLGLWIGTWYYLRRIEP